LIQHFLRYNEDIEDINRAFNNNLIKKYETLTELEYDGEGVSIEWDRNYIKEKESKGKRITQKVTIPKSNERDIDIIGNTAPIYISGDPFLMVVGYEAGFGEKNSMGFGLAEEAKKRN
jgi:CRISPR-associated endoribonuclease Cas6